MRRLRAGLRCPLALLVCLWALVCDPVAHAQNTQGIAAVVNDDVITTQDLVDRLNLGIATSSLPNDAATRQRLAPQVLRGFVDEKLELQEAKRLKIDVSEDDVNRALETVAQRNRMTGEQLTQYLSSRGLNPQTLRDQLRAQIAWIKIVTREIRPKIVVTQEQIDLAMKRGSSTADNTEVELSEILLPVDDRTQEDKVVANARDLVATLRAGTSFAALARQVSSAGTAENGGDLGWVSLGAVTPDLREQIAAMSPGQISDPIVGPDGVRIVQLRDRRSQAAAAPTDREAVRQAIEQQQLERQAGRYLLDLRREAFIDVRL